MNKNNMRLIFITVAVISFLHFCDALSNKNGYDNNYKDLSKETLSSWPNTTGRGIGMSAWGIIMFVVCFILTVVGMYYFSICYPVLCKKSRKYDIMGSSSVA